jgi:hypothetical protein
MGLYNRQHRFYVAIDLHARFGAAPVLQPRQEKSRADQKAKVNGYRW